MLKTTREDLGNLIKSFKRAIKQREKNGILPGGLGDQLEIMEDALAAHDLKAKCEELEKRVGVSIAPKAVRANHERHSASKRQKNVA